MSSAPRKGWAASVVDSRGPLQTGYVPVLAFTTEAERDEAADLLDTVAKGGKVYTREAHRMVGESGVEFAIEADRLRTRLAEAERETVSARRLLRFIHKAAHSDTRPGIVLTIRELLDGQTARRFLQGESKDEA